MIVIPIIYRCIYYRVGIWEIVSKNGTHLTQSSENPYEETVRISEPSINLHDTRATR